MEPRFEDTLIAIESQLCSVVYQQKRRQLCYFDKLYADEETAFGSLP